MKNFNELRKLISPERREANHQEAQKLLQSLDESAPDSVVVEFNEDSDFGLQECLSLARLENKIVTISTTDGDFLLIPPSLHDS